MGIAERFRNKLEKRDIFSPPPPEEKNKYMSEPIKKDVINPINNLLNSNEPKEERYPLEDLETQIIEKIRRTPYWNEYSIQKQENLITSYLGNKQNIYNNISENDKKEFIKNIIILSNNNK